MKMKTYASFDEYLADQSPKNQTIIRALRKFVKRVAPMLAESVKWGNGCWIGEKWPVAYVYSDPGFVQFGFFRGATLKDPLGLLEGKGQYVRHIKVRNLSDIDEKAFAALLRQSAGSRPTSGATGKKAARATNGGAETQLQGCFAKYEPRIARLGKALRAKLRRRLPGLFEVVYVYENQNALVIAYSPTEQGYEGLCSLGLYPDGAKLFFTKGALLSKSDPSRLLRGSAGVRHVVMGSAADFDRLEIEALMAAALEIAKVRLDSSANGSVIIRAESQKKRARRATGAMRTRPNEARSAR